ncbi:MAG: CDP-diacylglycerol--glycerol-3-phosphate 3-phosphatidyltransferase [Deltaproteobacteria bacterium]|nr:CDP-diacylglycerol--glycerol-3-phosphate 3-phosphatidyltransferase [Deltaproteobacteria bacterium]MBK8238118.1 CDP-diacylglycerol--glycerol-3-phosphate 3-phosphatidyltransferase [Deltaproteobacteria bacterium]MBK8718538.1 CDP-diacylglycerol--glycerol-3-phosphate 3-phosphatidyltransferase [Deltaproteobacteria bacterium]MBP7288600.1 CDP-diacylglycerol--glycerol-3-phosphate 3-phosphatidyltransferase [Nannocystaceae bacterium]
MNDDAGERRTRPQGWESFKREVLNLPNLITIGRLFLIPPVLVLIDPTDPLRNFYAALLFAAASGLDILDGWLARSRNLVTVFGKFVDPLADKLMAMSVMVWLVMVGLLPPWIVVLMLGRDFYISGLRSVAANQGVVIAAGEGGKAKTIFQLVGICCVLARYRYRMPLVDSPIDFHIMGMGWLYLALALSLWSALTYTLEFGNALKQRRTA